ncbi:MAG TPA: hypothetical protein VGE26_06885 [Sphingobacteriaceae bacterium]
MPEEELLKLLEGTMNKTRVQELAEVAVLVDSVSDLLELTFYTKREIAFRAAWVLEHLASLETDRFTEHVPDFLERYLKQGNQSCRRHYTKILMLLLKRRNSVALNNTGVIDATFEWLIDPQTPVAVKVNCLDILFMLQNQYDWIADELTAQIEFFLKDGSPAMQTRGKKILRQFKDANQ